MRPWGLRGWQQVAEAEATESRAEIRREPHGRLRWSDEWGGWLWTPKREGCSALVGETASRSELRRETPEPVAVSEADEAKLKFLAEAQMRTDPFASTRALDPVLQQQVDWISSLSPEQVREKREAATVLFEQRAQEFRASGAAEQWLAGCDSRVAQVVKDVNGPLMEWACQHTGWRRNTTETP